MNCPLCESELEDTINKSLIQENTKLKFGVSLDCDNCEFSNSYSVNMGEN